MSMIGRKKAVAEKMPESGRESAASAADDYEYYPPVTYEMLKKIREAAKVPEEDESVWETIDEFKW